MKSVKSEHIVVDGSNIATEGRNAPSLAQLEQAVGELRRERPDAVITVIVDATFAHRIDPSELDRFEQAALAGEYVHPPAGAIGRGDAFLLRVAEKVDGTVLSNDSFQEFHGEHPWLFERGRLIGATPVPGVGWIFSPRSPVRGPTSRKAVRDSEKAKRQVSKAIQVATKEAVAPTPPVAKKQRGDGSGGDKARLKSPPSAATAVVNDALTFISFIADHALGTEVTGMVDSYTSHGAVVFVGGTRCYIPLANLAVPAPRSARELLKRGESREFVVTALDPQRRGVELSLPGVGTVSGRPSEATIAAEVKLAKRPAASKAAAKKVASGKATAKKAGGGKAAAKKADTGKAAAKKAASGKAPAKEAAGRRAASRKEPAASTKSPSKKGASKEPAAASLGPAAPDVAAAERSTARKKASTPKKAIAPRAAPKKKDAASATATPPTGDTGDRDTRTSEPTAQPRKKAVAATASVATASAKRAAPLRKATLARTEPAKAAAPSTVQESSPGAKKVAATPEESSGGAQPPATKAAGPRKRPLPSLVGDSDRRRR